ncbi:MAG: efflux RND transporter periplasmic adaptor subunit [Gammaproteobacteria bacterium]|nr:efflux RND transporter periplasmic adaptor subunit [Gammaproteobacteria bacterium]
MKKRLIIVVLLLVLVFGGIFGYRIFINYEINKYMSHFAMPAVTVTVATSKAEVWQPSLSSVGTMDAVQGVNVSSQVAGMVQEIDFSSGQMVRKGQVLLKLNADVLKAQLQGNLAAVKLAQINYDRSLKLFKVGAIPKAVLDNNLSTLQEDEASVAQTEQSIIQTIIKAPFSGKLGIRQVNIGQYLNPGDTITNLQTVDPIYVNYFIPQEDIGKLSVGQAVLITVGTYPGVTFPAKINAIDAEVSDNTKSIAVQALVKNSNPETQLYPGMFANVTTLLPEQNNVVTVPQVAISYTLYGDSVFVVTDQTDKSGKTIKTANRVYVTTGEQRGDEVQILQGLKAGQVVVKDGQIKLQDTNPVTIANSDSSTSSS